MADILLVCEDKEIRSYLSALIKRCGHVVTRVASPEVAPVLLAEMSFDALITSADGNLSSGVTLAREARSIAHNIRVFFITGFTLVELKQEEEQSTDKSPLYPPLHMSRIGEALKSVSAA